MKIVTQIKKRKKMTLMGSGTIQLGVWGKEAIDPELCVGGKLSLVKPDGSVVEFDVFDVLHSDIVTTDEFGNEI